MSVDPPLDVRALGDDEAAAVADVEQRAAHQLGPDSLPLVVGVDERVVDDRDLGAVDQAAVVAENPAISPEASVIS